MQKKWLAVDAVCHFFAYIFQTNYSSAGFIKL